MDFLLQVPGEKICPNVISQDGRFLTLERIHGVRVFDLIRILKGIEAEQRTGSAARALAILFERLTRRLEIVQRTLFSNRNELSNEPYPMSEKVSSLLELLSQIMNLNSDFGECSVEIQRFGVFWQEHCSLLPFRDATTKNMIFSSEELSPELFSNPADRQRAIEGKIVKFDEDFWNHSAIFDIDFSSVEHLTTPEDDAISLYFHEWTAGSCPNSASDLNLIGDLFQKNSYRCAASFLVRYLRFGGRKLAYQLINCEGYQIRFRYDDPCFYFRTIEQRCHELDPQFVSDYPSIFNLLRSISRAISGISPKDRSYISIDHFRRVYNRADYWQENPGER